MKLRKLQQLNKLIYGVLILPLFLFSNAHIFVYHRFGDNRHPTTNTSIKELKKEFEYFKKNGYKVISLKKLTNALAEHKKIDDRWIVLTIDDNFKSFYTNALPVFKEYNYPFTLFVYVEATQKRYPDYTSWKELKEISKHGEIGFHSYSHPHMTYKSDKFLREDFKKGIKLIEKHLHTKPKYFAYPYGEYNNRIKNIAKEFGFRAILNQNIGAISKDSDIFDLDRCALVGESNLKRDLSYKELKVKWIEPKRYPSNGILKKIMAQLEDHKRANGGIYISGYGWQKVKVREHILKKEIDKKLLFKRNRIVINVKNQIKTKLLIKDNYDRRDKK